jgi:hypothetical protein
VKELEYSIENYRSLLQLALSEGYVFKSFLDPIEGEERVIYLRHDIDFSPRMAAELASVNHMEGVAGTFFVQLRSPFYNFFSYVTLQLLHIIEALGQDIGFHHFLPPWPNDDVLFIQTVTHDYETVKNHVPYLQAVFTYHNPVKSVLDRKFDVPGLVNPYNWDIPYLSESCLRHGPEEIAGFIKEGHPRIHLLFHPCYWVEPSETPQEVWTNIWHRLIKEREANLMNNRSYREHFPGGIHADIR